MKALNRRPISIFISHFFFFLYSFSVPSITGDIPIISTDFQLACEQAKSVFITAHVGPDGDTLGSMLALKFAFEKASQILDRFSFERIDCVIAGKMPHVYHFLPGITTVHNIETSQSLLEHYDLAISVDCGSLDRLGPSGAVFAKAQKSVNIDHHISNQCFGDINLVIPQACASGQVIFDILKEMNIPLDANIATCIYTAVVTDTGGFKYSNTNAKVFEMVADLVKAGAEPEYIYKQIYEIRPLSQFRIQAEAFKNTQFNEDYTLGWTQISQSMLKEFSASEDQIDGLVEGIRQVETVLIAAVFKETPEGFTKVSLRSDDHAIDVSKVMGQFGGGGHKMAAGCTIKEPLTVASHILLPILESEIKGCKAQKALGLV